MNRSIIQKLLAIAISVICILLFLLPYSEVFFPEEDHEGWRYAYILNDIILSGIYIPYAVLWILYLAIKNKIARNVLTVLLVALSGLQLFIAFGSVVFIAQDYVPSYGALLALVLPFLSFYYFVNGHMLNKSVKRSLT